MKKILLIITIMKRIKDEKEREDNNIRTNKESQRNVREEMETTR